MVKISILYPNVEGSRFDMAYYVATHMPIAIELLSAHPGYRGVSVEHGVAGAAPATKATYIAMCHFHFDSVDSFVAAFMPHAATLRDDVPNYTDVTSVIQFNEVVLTHGL